MWQSLPLQCQLLLQDCVDVGITLGNSLTALDIGCGTGLASELLLSSMLGNRISQIDLLDTSEEMLERAKHRAKKWRVNSRLLHGVIEDFLGDRKYDIIICCSVLHHIPDLGRFLSDLQTMQVDGGVFLHLQDPNGDFLGDPTLKHRMCELSDRFVRLPNWLRRFNPTRIAKSLSWKLGSRQAQDYMRRVSDELIIAGVTAKPMSPQDIWTVTDIHCLDGLGIRTSQLRGYLLDYELISSRSYGFFGRLFSDLPKGFKRQELSLIHTRAPNGLYIAGAWKIARG